MTKILKAVTSPPLPVFKSKTEETGMLFQRAFLNIAQPNIITTVHSGKILTINRAACKLLGYSRKEVLTKNSEAIFKVSESSFRKMLQQRRTEASATAIVTAIKKSGKLFPCEITSVVFRDKNGIERAVTTMTDMNRNILKQKEKDKIFHVAAKVSYDGIWDWNILTNEFFWGEGFKELFGYIPRNVAGSLSDWSKHLHPEDRDSVVKELQDILASKASYCEHAYRFMRADGSVANVFGRASIIRDAEGKACRMIGAIHDISKQKILEEKLEQEIKLKENYVARATEDAKEMERSDIGKELHDNVNQLLSTSRLYLDMAKEGGENNQVYLSRCSEYTLMAIEEIRKLTKRLTSGFIADVGLCDAIENVSHDTMEINPVKISCTLDSFIEDSVNDKFKLNVLRIVQEQLNNILKHAQATRVAISLAQNKRAILLTISDNGIGFDVQKKREGIGMDNIRNRAAYYNGKTNFVSQPGQGCVLTAIFPVTTALLRHE